LHILRWDRPILAVEKHIVVVVQLFDVGSARWEGRHREIEGKEEPDVWERQGTEEQRVLVVPDQHEVTRGVDGKVISQFDGHEG
jgi:hypothetical protein